MADSQAVELSQKVVEECPKLLEAETTSAEKQLEALHAIYTKTGYVEQRVESLQKLKKDQFRRLVHVLSEFDHDIGFLRAINEVFDLSAFESELEQKVFLWAGQLKARGEKLYAVFDVERQIITAKVSQIDVQSFGDFESACRFRDDLEDRVKLLEFSLNRVQQELQLTLRNCFRPEFKKLLEGLDVKALETKIETEPSSKVETRS